MKKLSNICLIGDVLIDVSLKSKANPLKLRLGGIAHAARALWAIGIPYSIAYFSPEYNNDSICKYFLHHGCDKLIKLGNVIGSPYVFLIEEVKEIGDQGYDFLLRKELKINYSDDGIYELHRQSFSDIIFIAGNYDSSKIIRQVKGKANLHIDVANNVDDLNSLKDASTKFETIFVSTSSSIFKKYFNDDFKKFIFLFKNFCNRIVLKENRGGSRGYDFKNKELISVSSQTQPITHSVGVGDVYNSAYVANINHSTFEEALTVASWIATEYALTTYPDDLKNGIERILNTHKSILRDLKGISLPWEKRNNINIYIAAPDFDYNNREPILKIDEALKYHNFKPRRPVLENGQLNLDASAKRKREVYEQDIKLLNECSILIAVIISDDPGTYIEIGYASAINMPIIIYDPYGKVKNNMVTQSPELISSDLDEIISEVFIQSLKLNK